MTKRLTTVDRGRVAEKIMEWGNLVFVTSVVAQAVSNMPYNYAIATIGFVGIIAAYVIAILIMKGVIGK